MEHNGAATISDASFKNRGSKWSGPGDLLGSRALRALASSAVEKVSN